MKKFLTVTAMISALVVSIASAQTTVSSANVVGYNQITLPSNQFTLVSTSFIVTSNTISDLFGDLPSGTTIYIWDVSQQKYITSSKSRAGWDSAATNTIQRGSGVFITLPAGYSTNVYMSGDVPNDSASGVHVASGYSLLSYPYPADVAFTNTALAKNAVSGDVISFWNNGWVNYGKSRAGWEASVSNINLKIGQAFFYSSSTNATRNETQPYTISN